jgi:hypothetical protein
MHDKLCETAILCHYGLIIGDLKEEQGATELI